MSKKKILISLQKFFRHAKYTFKRTGTNQEKIIGRN